MATITWTKNRWSEEGSAGGMRLFSVGWGMTRKETMWYLDTTLPLRPPSMIGQHYDTADDAKAAAETLLANFARRVTTPATPAADESGAGA